MWYKEAKFSDWKSLLITIPVSVLIGLAIGKGWLEKSPQDIQNRIIQEYSSPEDLQKDLQYGLQEEDMNSSNIPSNGPDSLTDEVQQSIMIDIDKIIEIESSGNPRAINSRSGARGLMQIMEGTWNEMVRKMGVNWNWNDAYDSEKNRRVGDYYMNTEIPRLLNHYGLPDTIKMRLAAYNWGIGHVRNTYRLHGENWENYLPEETSNYFIRYGL